LLCSWQSLAASTMEKLQQKATELLATEKGRFLVAGVSAATLLATATYIIRSQRPSRRKLKLFYFDIPGKGEAIRLACAFAGVPLEDVRIPMDDRKLFEQMKAEGKLTFNQLPALQIEDGTLLTQSAAIMRYIGKVGGLYPSDPVAAALVDAVLDAEVDLFAGTTLRAHPFRSSPNSISPSLCAWVHEKVSRCRGIGTVMASPAWAHRRVSCVTSCLPVTHASSQL
jgi:Glutathione S-transferase, N-terminal domain